MDDAVVPSRFAATVLSHAVAAACSPRHPLILAVEGPPGTGKSFQIRHCLESSGFRVQVESAANLSGSWEGDSIEGMRRLWKVCEEQAAADPDRHPVMVLEDFDLSPAGARADVRYTVNSQLLTGHLMNLADDPAATALFTGFRVPIIITGNDMSVLHGPLARPGRMEHFVWQPTVEEREASFRSALQQARIPDPHGRSARWARREHLTVAHVAAAVSTCERERAYEWAVQQATIDLPSVRDRFLRGMSVTAEMVEDRLGLTGPGLARGRRR